MRIGFLFLCFSFVLVGTIKNGYAQTHTPIQVVTSFSILEDLVTKLGGGRVQVINLVGRNSDAHTYQPKPSDAIAIAKADLVVVNGLGFEGWITRLMDNSGYQNARLIASENVHVLILGADEVDPHAWQSLANICIYADNITRQLIALKPEYTAEFTARHDEFVQKVDVMRDHFSKQLNAIALEQRVIVTSHDAFNYLGREWSIQFLAPMGLSTDAEASASDVSAIIQHIKSRSVKALFIENINNPRLLQQISAETGVAIGGKLYSDALSDLNGPAATYLAMMHHNIMVLTSALKHRN
jgi:zinc/manganese transport system substrate-binding protein